MSKHPLARHLWFLAAIVLLVWASFWPVANNGFVDWDDNTVVVQNHGFRGVSAEHLHYIFTNVSTQGYYCPVTWLSFCLDHYLSGVSPRGVHLTSLAIHTINAVLFYWLALTLIGRALPRANDEHGNALRMAAMIATLLFAVHPLRVEAIAWATARGYLLAASFLLLATLVWLRRVDGIPDTSAPLGFRRIILPLLLFAASLLSVPAGMAFPLVLLVLDVYPLKRLPARGGWWSRGSGRLVLEKTSFFVLAAVAAGTAPLAKRMEGSLTTSPLDQRLALAAYGTAAGFLKTFVPVWLSPIYAIPADMSSTRLVYVLSAVLLVATTVGLIAIRKRFPAGLAAWVCFLALTAPVSRLVQYGPLATADRYTYLSCMGVPLVVVGAGLWWYTRRVRWTPSLWLVAPGVIVVALVLACRFHVATWKDSASLFKRAIAVDPRCSKAISNLANLYLKQGRVQEAIVLCDQCLTIDPRDRFAHFNLGRVLSDEGHLDKAIPHLQAALAEAPHNPNFNGLLGLALARKGDTAQAVEHYRLALGKDESFRTACVGLTGALIDGGFEAAAEQVSRFGLERMPEDVSLLNNLAWLQATANDPTIRSGSEAGKNIRKAIELNGPTHNASLLDTLGAALAETGDFEQAVRTVEQAAQLARGGGDVEQLKEIEAHLARLKQGSPIRRAN